MLTGFTVTPISGVLTIVFRLRVGVTPEFFLGAGGGGSKNSVEKAERTGIYGR
jgi:hypothetical protein